MGGRAAFYCAGGPAGCAAALFQLTRVLPCRCALRLRRALQLVVAWEQQHWTEAGRGQRVDDVKSVCYVG